jgi:hypothetical protein
MYLLNSTQYTSLSSSNPTVTFSLANTISGGSTVNIQLPFSAFALRASYPFVSNDTYYFPLKRASNETQYTLGRTFLQEAYLTVDYDRGNFSIHQCSWIDGATSTIIPIKSPSSTSTNGTSDLPDTHSSTSLKPGPIVGIIFGVLAFFALVLGLVLFFLRRHKLVRRKRDSQLLAGHHALTDIRSRNDDKGLDTKHSSINTNISSSSKSTNSHYDQQQQSPNPSTFLDKFSPHVSQQHSLSLYPHSSFQPPTPTPSELDSREKQIHQLPGESRKWELGNTDTGWRYELDSKRSDAEEALPVELPAEELSPPENALIRAMRMSELVSPTLGNDERYIRLGSEPRPGLGSQMHIRADGPQSYQERFPDATLTTMSTAPSFLNHDYNRNNTFYNREQERFPNATPTTMSTAPSFLNHDYNQNNTFYNRQRESQSTRRTSGWRASSFLRGRDSSSLSPGPGEWPWSAETPRPVSTAETMATVSTPATARRFRAAGFI